MSGSLADWTLVVISALVAGVPALLAVGGLWVKVSKLEVESRLKVSRELYDERNKHIDEKLADIKRMLHRALGEQDTQP